MVRKLQWDSDFFKLSIGRVDVLNLEEWKECFQDVQTLKANYDLIYVFSKFDCEINDKLLPLADIKTIYRKEISHITNVSSSIDSYDAKEPNENLYELALISGVYSRFRLDKRFPSKSYERMYGCWIEQSTNGKMADKVFVHRSNGVIDGMITLKIDDEEGHIGLVAVGEDCRGKGIGSLLVQAVEEYLYTNTSIRLLKVVTQWENIPARHLYEKNGFLIDDKTNIYHWWL